LVLATHGLRYHVPVRLTLLLVFSAAALAQNSLQIPDFPINLRQGLMVGEVSETTAILQSRLTSTNPYQDTAWEGVRGVKGWAYFEIADNEDFDNPRQTEWLEGSPFTDFIVKTKVWNLLPAQRYHYRLKYGPLKTNLHTSDAATFRTLGGRTEAAGYSLAVVTGMNYSFFHHVGGGNRPPYSGPDKHLGYPALESILKLKPDFFIGTGDNVYYDHPGHRGRAQTQHELRKKHHEQYSQQRFVDLFPTVGTYWLKDDHDHRFDDSDQVNPVRIRAPKQLDYYPRTNIFEGESGSGFEPQHDLGVRIFREQLPVVDPGDANAVTYRTHRVSRDLELFFVEGRDYRSPNDMPDGPLKTIWGAEQKEWLKRSLTMSDATFKLLVSPTPLVGPDGADKVDNHSNIGGFRHEGDEFFEWLVENKFDPDEFFITCGDRHWKYHSIHPSGFSEYASGALIDVNSRLGEAPGDDTTTDPDGLINQVYSDPVPTGGFLVINVEPDGEGAVATFTMYDEKGKQLYQDQKRRTR